eukprot:gene13123-8969_t
MHPYNHNKLHVGIAENQLTNINAHPESNLKLNTNTPPKHANTYQHTYLQQTTKSYTKESTLTKPTPQIQNLSSQCQSLTQHINTVNTSKSQLENLARASNPSLIVSAQTHKLSLNYATYRQHHNRLLQKSTGKVTANQPNKDHKKSISHHNHKIQQLNPVASRTMNITRNPNLFNKYHTTYKVPTSKHTKTLPNKLRIYTYTPHTPTHPNQATQSHYAAITTHNQVSTTPKHKSQYANNHLYRVNLQATTMYYSNNIICSLTKPLTKTARNKQSPTTHNMFNKFARRLNKLHYTNPQRQRKAHKLR